MKLKTTKVKINALLMNDIVSVNQKEYKGLEFKVISKPLSIKNRNNKTFYRLALMKVDAENYKSGLTLVVSSKFIELKRRISELSKVDF